MIRVKRLNGVEFYLNSELIEQVEATPDTVITLTTGNNIVVQESVDEVVRRVIDYRRRVYEERQAAIVDLAKRNG